MAKPAPSSGAWNEVQLVGTAAGTTMRLRRREDGRGRGWKPDCSAELGRVLRAGKRAGHIAGKVVCVIGAEAVYTSAEQEDDMGDAGCASGWWVWSHVRLATDAEAAPVIAAEQAAASKRAAVVESAAAKKAAWDEALATATAGLVSTTWLTAEATREIARHQDGSVSHVLCEAALDGQTVVVLHSGSYDDSRSYVYAPLEFIAERLAARAAELGVDRAKAIEWLSRYAGCCGEELYRVVAGVFLDEPAATVRERFAKAVAS
jgi:hypothetical protein